MENRIGVIEGVNDNIVYVRSRYRDFHKLVPVDGMDENVRRLVPAEGFVVVGLLNGKKFEKEIKRIFYRKEKGFLIQF